MIETYIIEYIAFDLVVFIYIKCNPIRTVLLLGEQRVWLLEIVPPLHPAFVPCNFYELLWNEVTIYVCVSKWMVVIEQKLAIIVA